MKQLLLSNGFRHGIARQLMLLSAIAIICGLLPVALVAAPTITYVQSAYSAPQTPQTAVNVAYMRRRPLAI